MSSEEPARTSAPDEWNYCMMIEDALFELEHFEEPLCVIGHSHYAGAFEKDDKPQKQTARKMIQLVRDTNAKLGGTARVTCFTCHRGQTRPAS